VAIAPTWKTTYSESSFFLVVLEVPFATLSDEALHGGHPPIPLLVDPVFREDLGIQVEYPAALRPKDIETCTDSGSERQECDYAQQPKATCCCLCPEKRSAH